MVVRGDFRFEGDQSKFNQDGTTLRFSKSHSEIGTAKSLFMRPIEVFNKSQLVIDAANVEMPHDVTVKNSQFIVNPGASFTLKSGATLLFERVPGYPSEKPSQMEWEEGSFANELTKVYKNHYDVSFDDGTSLSFYYDEAEKTGKSGDTSCTFSETLTGELEIKASISETISKDSLSSLHQEEKNGTICYTVPLGYGKSVEIYENPDNAGKYTATDAYRVELSEDNIVISTSNPIIIKTLSADEITNPSRKELIHAKDDLFTYTINENGNYIRTHQTLWQGVWKDFAIGTVTSGTTNILNTKFTVTRTQYNMEIVAGGNDTYNIPLQGNSSTGIYYTKSYNSIDLNSICKDEDSNNGAVLDAINNGEITTNPAQIVE